MVSVMCDTDTAATFMGLGSFFPLAMLSGKRAYVFLLTIWYNVEKFTTRFLKFVPRYDVAIGRNALDFTLRRMDSTHYTIDRNVSRVVRQILDHFSSYRVQRILFVYGLDLFLPLHDNARN